MNRSIFHWVVVVAGLSLVAAHGLPVAAHHSFAAEFDDTQPLKLTGTITKVEWSNPHIWYYVDVKNPDGTVTNWALSGGAPGQLMRRGITKDLLQVGSMVVVEGFRAKDGSTNGFGSRITYPDGRNVLTATAQDRQAAPSGTVKP
jgi:hypothetical protein